MNKVSEILTDENGEHVRFSIKDYKINLPDKCIHVNYQKETFNADKSKVVKTELLELIKSGDNIEIGQNDLADVLTENGL